VPRKVFVAGEILTAADVNTNLMDQAVMVFDDSAARGSAIPTPSEGMVTYLKDTDLLEQFTGAAFVPVTNAGVGSNIVQTVKTDTFTTTSQTFTDVTGLSATITPTSATSKILVIAFVNFSVGLLGESAIDRACSYRLEANSSGVFVGDSAGSRIQSTLFHRSTGDGGSTIVPGTLSFLHSPATTSAVTYKITARVQTVGAPSAATTVNRSAFDPDSANTSRTTSSITAIEVKA
jgi:hypothetical protein